jgi:MerR family transcriptional regulator/heat shock protein HspR
MFYTSNAYKERSMFGNLHDERRPVYTISIAAELIGCHPRTLRIYEEEGLIHPKRTKKNIRLYSQEDILMIKEMCELMDEWSLNLSGVKALFEAADRFHIGIKKLLDEMID